LYSNSYFFLESERISDRFVWMCLKRSVSHWLCLVYNNVRIAPLSQKINASQQLPCDMPRRHQ
jgi:hypothetical protein